MGGAPDAISDDDLAGLDLYLSADDLGGGIVTLDALRALLDQGHGTNLYKLYRRGM